MLHAYRAMIDDPLRLGLFERAIAAEVRPGDAVADVGCGLGTYSIFACRAGADKVVAVDHGPILSVARDVIATNGWSERVTCLRGTSTALTPPYRARVVLFEDYLSPLFSPSTSRVIADLRTRWLAPGGVLLPARARVHVALVEDARVYGEIDRFSWRKDRVFDIDFSVTRPLLMSSIHHWRLSAASLLSDPTPWCEVELLHLDAARLGKTAQLRATRSGTIHGLLFWFDLLIGDTWLSTGPTAPQSAWHQNLIALDHPIAISAGDVAEVELAAGPFGEDMVWRWRIAAPKGSAQGSTLDTIALDEDGLRVQRAAHVPTNDPSLELARFVLEQIDGARSVEAICQLVSTQWPDRFATPDDALGYVTSLITTAARA